jgi:hypothetical protein
MEEISIKNRLELMNVLPSEACGEVFTRADVANNVLKLLKAKPGVFSNPNYRFLDIYTKSGVFLLLIYSELMQGLVEAIPDPEIRSQHILDRMIYGISPSVETALISRKTLYGDWSIQGNIKVITGYKNDTGKRTFSNISKEFNGMKFDVVIGNPPYNNDMYLDFVTLAHQLSSKYTCMITPAKWQAKTDGKPAGSKTPDKNEQFRKNIVPYMSDIVYYKDSQDLFDIQEWGGISIILLDKEEHNEKQVNAVCKKNHTLESGGFEIHDETSVVLLSHKILKIIGKVGQLGEGFKQSLYVKNTDHGESSIMGKLGFKRFTYTSEQERGEKLKQAGYVEVMQGDKVVGYKAVDELFTTANLDKYKCICSIMPGAVAAFDSNNQVLGMFKISIIGPNQVPKGSFPVLKYLDSIEQCNSFVSFMYSRLIAFLYYLGTCGTTLTKEFFRFVPDPNDWTCTYVDAPHPGVTPDSKGIYTLDGVKYCSLYARYNLDQDDINIIESVIKERKQGE